MSTLKQLEPNEKTNLILRVGKRVPFSGLICAVLAGMSFTASKIFIKKVDTVHPTVNVCIRGLIIMIFYGGFVLYKRLPLFGKNRKEFLGLCGRGFFGLIVCVTSYTALWRIPLGDSITLLLTATVFTSILARIFLKEDFTLVNILCVILTMFGVIMIAKPPFLFRFFNNDTNQEYDMDKMIGILLTLIAAISFAFSYVILRALRGVNVDLIVTYFGVFNFFGTFMILPLIKPFIDHPETVKIPETFHEWQNCLGVAIAGMLGEFFLTSAFQLEKANYIAILRCGDVLIAYIAESIFFHSEFQATTWNIIVGAILILFSVILTTAYKSIKEKFTDQDSLNKEEIIPKREKC